MAISTASSLSFASLRLSDWPRRMSPNVSFCDEQNVDVDVLLPLYGSGMADESSVTAGLVTSPIY